jgi:hypothetical protein
MSLVASTVAELRAATTVERVVLWLAEHIGNRTVVCEVFVPLQLASADYFHIPPQGMEQLLRHLRARRLLVAAQVHTHPVRAFHSAADDKWAIVRHAGALSLVVPRFCQDTSAETFATDAVVYQLDEGGNFVLAAGNVVYAVTP